MKSLVCLILVIFLAAPFLFLALRFWNVSFCPLDVLSPLCQSAGHWEKILQHWSFLTTSLLIALVAYFLIKLAAMKGSAVFDSGNRTPLDRPGGELNQLAASFRFWLARHENSPNLN